MRLKFLCALTLPTNDCPFHSVTEFRGRHCSSVKRMSKTFSTQVTTREAGGSLVVVLTGGNVTPTELTELEAQIGK